MHHEEERMPLHLLLFCEYVIILLLACATDVVFTDLSLLQKDLFDDFPVLNIVTSPSIGPDGRIYACIGGIAKAYNRDGSLAWMARLNESCQILVSPVLDQNGMVYVAVNTRVMIISYSEEENSVTISDLYNATTLDQNMMGIKPITGLSLMQNSTSVLVNAGPAGLYAVTIDGTLLWSTDGYSSNGDSVFTAGTFCPVQDVICYFHFSPAIDYCDGSIYIAHTNGWLYAIDGSQPYVKWQYYLESSANTSVAGVTAGNNGRVYVATVTGSVYVLDTDTGTLLWQVIVGPLTNRTCFPRLDSKGRVILGSLDGFLYVISIDGQRIKRYLHDSAAYSVIHSCPYVDCSKQEVFVAQVSVDAKVTSKSDVSYIAAKGVTIFALDTSNGNALLFDNYKGQTIENRGDSVLDTSLLLAVFASNQSGGICNNVDSTERWTCAFWSSEFTAGVPAFIGRSIQPMYIALPLSFFVLGLGLLLWFIWLKSYWNNYTQSSDRGMKSYAFPELQVFFQRRALYKNIVSKLEMSLRNDPQSQHLQRQFLKAQEDFYTNEWILSQFSLQQEHSKFPNVEPIQDQMAPHLVHLKYSSTKVPMSLNQSADITLTRYSIDETGQTSASQAFSLTDNSSSMDHTHEDYHGMAPTSKSSVNPLFLGSQFISSELQPVPAVPVSSIETFQNNFLYLDNAFQPLPEASNFNVSHSFTKEVDNHHPYLIPMNILVQGNENASWAEGLDSRREWESPICFQDYPSSDYGFMEGSELGFEAESCDFTATEIPSDIYKNDSLEEFQPDDGDANTDIFHSLQPMRGQQDPENTLEHPDPGAMKQQFSEHDYHYTEIPHLNLPPESSGSKEEGYSSYSVEGLFPGSDHLQRNESLLKIANQGITSEDGTQLPQTTTWLPGFEAGVFERASTLFYDPVAEEKRQLQNLQQGIQDEKEDQADDKPTKVVELNNEPEVGQSEKLQQQDPRPSTSSHASENSIEDPTLTPRPDDLILGTESNGKEKMVSSPDVRSYLMHLPSISEDPEAEAWEANQDEKGQLDFQGTASGYSSDKVMQPDLNNLRNSPLDQPSAEILEETRVQNHLSIFEIPMALDTDADHQNLQNQGEGTAYQPTEETSLSTANQVPHIGDHDSKELESVSNPEMSIIQRTSSLSPAEASTALLSQTSSMNPATDARKSLSPRASSSNQETEDLDSQKHTALERIASTDSGTSSYTDASDTESDEETYQSLDEFEMPWSETRRSALSNSRGSSFSVMNAAEEEDNNKKLHTDASDTESDEETDQSVDEFEIPWSKIRGSTSSDSAGSSRFSVMNAEEEDDKNEELLRQRSSRNRPRGYESTPRSIAASPLSEEQFNGKAFKIRPLRISRNVLPVPGPPLSRSQSEPRGMLPVSGPPSTRSQSERRGTLPVPGVALTRSQSDRRSTLPIPGVALTRSQSDRRSTLPIPGVSLTGSHPDERGPFQSPSPTTRPSTWQQSRASVRSSGPGRGSESDVLPVESSHDFQEYHPRRSLR